MRGINITNDKKRDALVAFATWGKKSTVTMVLPNGEAKRNIRFIKSVVPYEELLKKHGDPLSVGKAVIAGDEELDIETAGKFLNATSKLYKTGKGDIAYSVTMLEVLRSPDGSEKERRDLAKNPANIAVDVPLQWTGRKFQREEAIRKFVFTRSYQLFHTNGLTYDFLYGMAKTLHEENALMFIGGGKKGSDPIVITAGGDPYRGFLEGRIDGDKYLLALHLTNMELKPLKKNEGDAA